jgi:hypothetical protein
MSERGDQKIWEVTILVHHEAANREQFCSLQTHKNTRKQQYETNTKPIRKIMKRLTKSIVLFAALAMASQVARAQNPNSGDLVLGFTSTATADVNDYIVDLGSLSTLVANGVTDLSSFVNLSTLNSTISSVSARSVGAIYGAPLGVTGDTAALTVLRTGNNASGSQGTESAPGTPGSGNLVSSAGNQMTSILLGTPVKTSGNSMTFAGGVNNANSFSQDLGTSCLASFTTSTISLDLFETTRLAPSGRNTPASPFSYVGTLNIDVTGPNAVVDFVAAGTSVPEPASFGLLAGAGLLIVSLRRKLSRANA